MEPMRMRADLERNYVSVDGCGSPEGGYRERRQSLSPLDPRES